jgi:hypothetical protein
MNDSKKRLLSIQSSMSARERQSIWLNGFHEGTPIDPRLLDGLSDKEAERWDEDTVLINGVQIHGRWALSCMAMEAQVALREMRLFHLAVKDCLRPSTPEIGVFAAIAVLDLAKELSARVRNVWRGLCTMELAIARAGEEIEADQDLIDADSRKSLNESKSMIQSIRSIILDEVSRVQLPVAAREPGFSPDASEETLSRLSRIMDALRENLDELPAPEEQEVRFVFQLFQNWNAPR